MISFFSSFMSQCVLMFIYSWSRIKNDRNEWIADEYKYGEDGIISWVKQNVVGGHTTGPPTHYSWELLCAHIFSWTSIYLCAIFGVRTSGYISIFTVIIPVGTLIILLCRSATLADANVGIAYLYSIADSQLLYTNLDVWSKATSQVCVSLSLCWGTMILFGSFTDRTKNVGRNATIVVSLNSTYSILSAITVFAALGHLRGVRTAKLLETKLDEPRDELSKDSTWWTTPLIYNFGLDFFEPTGGTDERGNVQYAFNPTIYAEWFQKTTTHDVQCSNAQSGEICDPIPEKNEYCRCKKADFHKGQRAAISREQLEILVPINTEGL